MGYKLVKIPKKGKGFRIIAIPEPKLLYVQRGELKNLNGKLNNLLKLYNLQDVMHGFMKYKSPVTAAEKHIGYDCTIIMDITDFFDSCSREAVEKLIGKTKDEFYDDRGYLVQGFATSPVLANVCLAPVLDNIRYRLFELNYNHSITVYADDIQISLMLDEEGFAQQNKVISIVEEECLKYNFIIKRQKTRIRYAKHGYRRILGINVGDDALRPTRKTLRRIRAAKHQCNYSSLGGLVNCSRCNPPLTKEERLRRKEKRLEAQSNSVVNPH